MGIRTGAPSDHWASQLYQQRAGSLFIRFRTRALSTVRSVVSTAARIFDHAVDYPLVRLMVRRVVVKEARQYSAQFEKLVDLMCAAARDGVVGDREGDYAILCRWMQHHGPSLLSTHAVKTIDWSTAQVNLNEFLSVATLDAAISRLDTIALIVELRQLINLWLAAAAC